MIENEKWELYTADWRTACCNWAECPQLVLGGDYRIQDQVSNFKDWRLISTSIQWWSESKQLFRSAKMHQKLGKIVECEVIDNNNVAGVCENILIGKNCEKNQAKYLITGNCELKLIEQKSFWLVCHAAHRPLWLERGEGFIEKESGLHCILSTTESIKQRGDQMKPWFSLGWCHCSCVDVIVPEDRSGEQLGNSCRSLIQGQVLQGNESSRT